jgi:hypothetical protein
VEEEKIIWKLPHAKQAQHVELVFFLFDHLGRRTEKLADISRVDATQKGISLHFGKINSQEWKLDLKDFVQKLRCLRSKFIESAMRKYGNHLVLHDMFSTMTDPLDQWRPRTLEDTYTAIDLSIGMSDGEKGSNLFYVKVATPEALRRRAKGFLIVDRRVMVIEKFDYELLRSSIEGILEKCDRDNWDDSCLALQRYFAWEYEDYIHENS